MFNIDDFVKSIFDPSLIHFDELALKAFAYQYDNNIVYQQYCKLNKILDKQSVTKVAQIPFLPIQFFKSHAIVTGTKVPEIQFTSSSTSGQGESKHLVVDGTIYTKSFFAAFEHFYGPITDYCFLALLPSYLERTGSSLLLMCDELIKASNNPLSNFYLYNHNQLADVLLQLKEKKQKTILIGATFALLDFAETHNISFPELIVMETGGMKGRRKEITRAETHTLLANAFAVTNIHSEYGMTELLSQAYSHEKGVFECPKWMQIKISDPTDPFTFLGANKSGVINVIDLANIHSCCFIQTQDLGKLTGPKNFEVLGRLDNSDIRGCSLLTV
ncbi:MAG: acyl transferase [Bacteroidota bacterium]